MTGVAFKAIEGTMITEAAFYTVVDSHPKLRAAYFRAVNATIKSSNEQRRYERKSGIWARARFSRAQLNATSTMSKLLDGFDFDHVPLCASEKVMIASLVLRAARFHMLEEKDQNKIRRHQGPQLQPSLYDIEVSPKSA